jgi:predicted ATPase
VVISGEPGIGKTSLIREILRRSEDRGYDTLSARAAELERDLPFAVIAGALEGRLSPAIVEGGGVIDRADLELLASVLPSVGPAGVPGDAGPDRRHRTLRAFHTLLEALAADRTLVIALDDLHWADSASIDLVCRLLHRGIAQPSLLVLASRPAQTEARLHTAFEDA